MSVMTDTTSKRNEERGFSAVTHSLDTVFSVLSNERRRHVLHVLADVRTCISLEELTDRVAASEYDIPIARIPETVRADIEATLHHVHLPRLSDVGVVTYDVTERRVTEAGSTHLTSYLDIIEADRSQV